VLLRAFFFDILDERDATYVEALEHIISRKEQGALQDTPPFLTIKKEDITPGFYSVQRTAHRTLQPAGRTLAADYTVLPSVRANVA